MQESAQPTQQYNRRESDQYPHVQILLDIRTDLQGIKNELVEFKKDVNKAFPKDEDGLPDYVGHRKGHEKDNKEADKLNDYKNDFTKKLLSWAGVGFISFIFYAVVDYIRKGGA